MALSATGRLWLTRIGGGCCIAAVVLTAVAWFLPETVTVPAERSAVPVEPAREKNMVRAYGLQFGPRLLPLGFLLGLIAQRSKVKAEARPVRRVA